MRRDIVILSRSRPSSTARRFVEECKNLGLAVHLIAPECLHLTSTGEVAGLEVEPPKWLLNRLLGNESPLDHVLEVAQSIEQQWDQHSIILNRVAAVKTSLSKRSQALLFQFHAFPAPPTLLISGSCDAGDVFDYLGRPVVLKPTFGMGGDGVERFSSEPELARYLRDRQQYSGVAQAWLPEAAKTLRALVVSNRVVASTMRTARPGEWRANFARRAGMAPATLTPRETALAVDVTAAIGLDVGGVDIVRTATGPQLLEVNPSPGLLGIEGATKRNLTRAILDHLLVPRRTRSTWTS